MEIEVSIDKNRRKHEKIKLYMEHQCFPMMELRWGESKIIILEFITLTSFMPFKVFS